MINDRVPQRRLRLGLLISVCVVALGWNMALSSRRRNFSGKLVPVQKLDLDIKVSCVGKIEPKVQETLRAQLDGPRQSLLVKEGDVVKKGQLLMEIGEDQIRFDLSTKRTAYRNAYVEFAKAQKEYEFSKKLYQQLAIPKREVETAQQALERASQTLTSAKEELSTLEKKAGSAKIYSPIAGVVLKVFIENDSQISNGKELIKVAQIDKFSVRGKIDELDFAQVSVGQTAKVVCDAFAGTEMGGVVSWIGAQAADSSFPEIPVLIDIIDTKNLNLKANLTAEAEIFVSHLPNALVIPEAALHKSEKGYKVLKAGWGGWLTEQPVSLKLINAQRAVLTEGVTVSDSVLVPPIEE